MEVLRDVWQIPSLFSVKSAILVCVITFLIWIWKKNRNLPPGPWGWPLLGCLPNLIFRAYRTGLKHPHHLFWDYANEYGEIFSMHIGSQLVVVINEYNSMKEAFKNPDLSDRPSSPVTEEQGVSKGVGTSSGEVWKQLRKFSVKTLRSFDVGKSSFEENIVRETTATLERINHAEGKPIDPKEILAGATANVMCTVLFGKRFDYTDPELKKVLDLIYDQIAAVDSGGGMLFFPILRYIQRNSVSKLVALTGNHLKFLNGIVTAHQKDYLPNQPRDFIDAFLDEMKNEFSDTSIFDDEALHATLFDLLLASAESNAATLCWCLLHMLAYPEVCKRVQEEIDTVVGRDRLPALSDKPSLPYTEATLTEVQRIATVSPLGVAHSAGNHTTLGKFNIPKGAMVLGNIWAVHNNKKDWSKPDEFRPERFLDSSGLYRPEERFIPFGIGRRICFGDALSRMQLFIFFTHLLHQFTFKQPDGSPPLPMEGVSGLGYLPKRYKVIATRR